MIKASKLLNMTKYGIAVVGLGIAGRVRVRDISDPKLNEEGKWKLCGVVTRRAHENPPATIFSEEDMLKNGDINAIIVCTEPAQHEHVIRNALHHGKHVLVEYPVVPSASITRELYSLAVEKGLVLHEENIALLTAGYLSLKQQISEAKSPIVKGEISLVGSYNGWVEDFQGSGGPFCVNVSMIQTLYELFGADLKATGGHLERNEDSFTATTKLACAKCSDLTLRVRRTKEKGNRKKTSIFYLADGATITENPDVVVKKSSDTASDKPVSFQLQCRGQCTYPCFPGDFLANTLLTFLSKPLTAFPGNYSRDNSQRWERILCNDLHQLSERN